MANDCYYEMRIWGTKRSIKKFSNSMTRILGEDLTVKYGNEQKSTMIISGNCRWSLSNYVLPEMVGASQELDLIVEAYSSEPGNAFQEHYVIDRGQIMEESTADWGVHSIEDIEESEATLRDFLSNPLTVSSGITDENYRNFVDENKDISIGGFGKWKWKDGTKT